MKKPTRIMVSHRLHPVIVQFLRGCGQTQSRVIDEAVAKVHGLDLADAKKQAKGVD